MAPEPSAPSPAAPATPDTRLLEGLPQAAWLVALDDGRVVAANAAAARLFGRAADSLVGVRADALVASPEDLAWWQSAGAGGALDSEALVAVADGRALHVQRSIGLVAGADGVARHALVVLRDRSAERQVQDERERELAELQGTLEATADGILVTDADGGVRAFNQRFAELWGLPPALLQARDDAALHDWMADCVVPAADGSDYRGRLRDLVQSPLVVASDRIELRSQRVLERVTRPLVSGGGPQGRVWSFRDLTERLAAEQRIESLALHDALTGLPNRRRLAECVAEAVSAAGRAGGSFALLVVDLDRFRQLNDSLGQETGDAVLCAVAQRLRAGLRGDDLLARLGSDQFVLIANPADAAAAEATARRILNAVAQPCRIDGSAFTLTCSVGIALAPAHGTRLDDLLRHAENAVRAAKNDGRAQCRMHQTRDGGDRRADLRLDQAMRQALVSGRFRLHYQPQVGCASGRIVGAEALLRWRDPELGEVSPGRFIPVAEDSGFIIAIGDWVLSQAVRQAAVWHGRGCGLPIAVNVSALQFRQAHFVDAVAGVLAVSGLPPRLLELELTESILLRDADEALQRLHALARLGVRLSIDDFGTGYSSLAYLKRFPIGRLKIDRSFVCGLPEDEGDAGIVKAILQMARALRMKVVAEGVETEAQRGFLRDAGCDEFQGFLYAPALDILSFEQRLMQSEAAAAPPGDAPAEPGPRIRRVR